jgi:hypothetical protein
VPLCGLRQCCLVVLRTTESLQRVRQDSQIHSLARIRSLADVLAVYSVRTTHESVRLNLNLWQIFPSNHEGGKRSPCPPDFCGNPSCRLQLLHGREAFCLLDTEECVPSFLSTRETEVGAAFFLLVVVFFTIVFCFSRPSLLSFSNIKTWLL